MEIADNLAQVIAALGGLAGFTALGIELWTRSRRRRRPPDDLLLGLNWLNEAFGDIIANGGRGAAWFVEDGRRRQESLLALANGQIVDDLLNTYVGEARVRYQEAWTLSMRLQQQVGVVEKGQSACVKAIDRANELVRKYRV